MPGMHPSRARQICRSRNPFTPSVALWQHFVLPSSTIRSHQRFSSSASEAVESNKPEPFGNGSPQSSAGESRQDDAPKATVTKFTTGGFREVYHKPRQSKRPVQNQLKKRERPLPSPSAPDPRQQHIMMKAQNAMDSMEDYTGTVVEPASIAGNWVAQPTSDARLPWSLHRDELTLEGHVRLTSEIAKFHAYAKPSRSEALARRHVVEQIRSHVREILPAFMLEVFGSERTGLSLATSDIDLRLVTPELAVDTEGDPLPPSRQERQKLLGKLLKLRDHLVRKDHYLLCALRHARYPLISLQDRASGLDVQIVLSNDTSATRAAISKYLIEYPYLAEVYTVVKSMFDIRGLSDVFRGGFGGYSIFMMIVASFQSDPPEKADAAHGLLSFLRFWSTFDTTQKGISIEPSELFDKDETAVMPGKVKAQFQEGKKRPAPPFMLRLRDPADPTNDLGRKGASIKHVQATCQHLFDVLQSNIRQKNTRTHLKAVVGPVYDLHRRRREKLGIQGTNVLAQVQVALAAKARRIRDAEKETEAETAARVAVAAAETAPFEHGESIASGFGMPSVEELMGRVLEKPATTTPSSSENSSTASSISIQASASEISPPDVTTNTKSIEESEAPPSEKLVDGQKNNPLTPEQRQV